MRALLGDTFDASAVSMPAGLLTIDAMERATRWVDGALASEMSRRADEKASGDCWPDPALSLYGTTAPESSATIFNCDTLRSDPAGARIDQNRVCLGRARCRVGAASRPESRVFYAPVEASKSFERNLRQSTRRRRD